MTQVVYYFSDYYEQFFRVTNAVLTHLVSERLIVIHTTHKIYTTIKLRYHKKNKFETNYLYLKNSGYYYLQRNIVIIYSYYCSTII